MDLSTAVQTIERIGKRGHDGIANFLIEEDELHIDLRT